MVWAWLAPPQLARLVRGVGAAHQSGVLYGGAAAACAVAAGSLYYADRVERSQNNSLAEELNASEQRRRRRFHTRWSAACRNRPSPLSAWLAWGGSCRPTPRLQACSGALVIALAPRRLAGAALRGSRAGPTRRGDQTRPLTLTRLYQARKEQAQATVAADAAALWRGAVVKSMPGMLNGEVMLRGVKVGDRIEVLAEESGPGGAYLTARNVTTGQVGFYPAGWVRHPERGVPAHGPVAC